MLALRVVAGAMVCLTAATAQMVYNVSPDGDAGYTIEGALEEAGPGDTLQLEDGVYNEPLITMFAGEEDRPLTIQGGPGAVINGATGDREIMWSQKVVDIRHSWITLKGFTINGKISDENAEESYSDKCVMVQGNSNETTMVTYQGEGNVETILRGFEMRDMIIKNCGLECVRMRNFVTHAVIANNTITDCGIWDFQYRTDGGKTGDAIQIGTSSNQWDLGEFTTNGEDGCNYNLVTGNTLTPNGNECVETKEGSCFNIIEDNDCSGQHDVDSGCYSMRGSYNTVRNNKADDCAGAGVRLGGNVVNNVVWGVGNEVYGNEFSNTGNLRNASFEEGGGSVVVMEVYQGQVCNNTCEGDYCDPKEKSKCNEEDTCDDQVIDYTVEWTWDQPCEDTVGYLGCFVEDNRGSVIADYDSSASEMDNQMCHSKCTENEFVGTMGEDCSCIVSTSYTFYYPCEESNDGEECDGDYCMRVFEKE